MSIERYSLGNYDIDNIYVLDCLKGMEKLRAKSIDLAFINPPYQVGKNYGILQDNLSHDEYVSLLKTVISHYKRLTKRGFGIYSDWNHFQEF